MAPLQLESLLVPFPEAELASVTRVFFDLPKLSLKILCVGVKKEKNTVCVTVWCQRTVSLIREVL